MARFTRTSPVPSEDSQSFRRSALWAINGTHMLLCQDLKDRKWRIMGLLDPDDPQLSLKQRMRREKFSTRREAYEVLEALGLL